MTDATWVIMPIAGAPEYTDAAISDVLAQSVPTRLLLIGQGLETPFRRHLEEVADEYPDRVFLWSYDPALPSLSAAWNRGLKFVWEIGGTSALVVNNDVRLHRETVRILDDILMNGHRIDGGDPALFVSAVGVTAEQFKPDVAYPDDSHFYPIKRGGPDFSCFMVSQSGHWKYPFDEGFRPAYGEDCDCHRRYMLGGDADRIFSINLPYFHYASGTLKSLDPEARRRKEIAIDGSRAYYARKWGPGGINHETFTIPFDPETAQPGVTNPELQASAGAHESAHEASDDDRSTATPSSPVQC